MRKRFGFPCPGQRGDGHDPVAASGGVAAASGRVAAVNERQRADGPHWSGCTLFFGSANYLVNFVVNYVFDLSPVRLGAPRPAKALSRFAVQARAMQFPAKSQAVYLDFTRDICILSPFLEGSCQG